MYGQFQPGYAGVIPGVQNRLNNGYGYNCPQSYVTAQYGAPMQATGAISGRPVGSMEEAKVAQVPLDGSALYFPCPQERKIFVKAMDLNGLSVFQTYALVTDEAQGGNVWDELRGRVERLEEVVKNGGYYAANGNVARQPEPNGNTAGHGGTGAGYGAGAKDGAREKR